MKPEKIGIKGPQGKGPIGRQDWPMPEAQEKYESGSPEVDLCDGNFTQDPFSLKAHEDDHTPNHTRAPKESKPGYGKSTGRGNGGVGL